MAALNIIEAIRSRADPGAPAVIHGERTLSYGQLFERCDAVCARLPATGKPLRIGIAHPGGIDYITLAMGVLAAGHCLVPLADELPGTERRSLMHRTALQGLITKAGDDFAFETLTPAATSFSETDFAALNPAFIRFSSGTTGMSKGVVLSHESLLARITAANEGLRIGPGDCVLWVLPMAHHFAVSIVLYLYHGATTVIEEQRLGDDLLRAGKDHRVTVMYGSPVHYRQLTGAALANPPNWSELRLAVSTASALDAATAVLFERQFHRPLVQGLGIIEVGLPMLNLDAPAESAGAIGRPLPNYEARLDDGGQLCLRGPGMFDAYLDPWQPRASVLDADGWLHTGDIAERDEGGRYYLKGRAHSVINVGGMKVFPEEIESVLMQHPGVVRCLVHGRAHPLYGEVPVAVFESGDGAAPEVESLQRHCRQHLARYKIPITFSAVPSVPHTPSGKVLRHLPS